MNARIARVVVFEDASHHEHNKIPFSRRSIARIDRRSNGMSMTPEEFDSARNFDDRYRYELIRGVLIVSPPPLLSERDANEELGHLLRNYRDVHPQGGALDDTAYEETVEVLDNRRRADRAIWTGLGRAADPKKDLPTIVVEFVSRSKKDRTRDYVEKRQEYLQLGVLEYWIIDRFRRIMTVARADQADLVVKEADVYVTPLLPGFELPLARLLKRSDRFKKKRS